ncbi:MAG: TIGR00730 family Rossman fold protein [Clostridia bacterium]|nr:TIGR00730 family Rossman fold protein [Clostridia bacterium]
MNVCVYGASSSAIDERYISAAYDLGLRLAQRGHGMVFGGGARGLMGAAARGVSSQGGSIIGVAPRFFDIEGVLFEKCTEFVYTDTMRERKQIMEDRSDAFIVLPGGIGTMEEFFEILTLKQLGRHRKAITILNTNGYYDNIEALFKNSVEKKFMSESFYSLYAMFSEPDALIDYIEGYDPDSAVTETSKF